MSILSTECHTTHLTIQNSYIDSGTKHEYHGNQAYASPDCKGSCDSCGEGCIDIKCPYSMRSYAELDLPYIVNNKLVKNHEYYYQAQMHL